MRKRLAKKAFSGRYYNIWMKPGHDDKIYVPRNGRCWCIIQRACYYYGHPEWIDEFTQSILQTIEDNR